MAAGTMTTGDDLPARTMRLASELGHVELSWDAGADAAMKAVIQQKIDAGVRFFLIRTSKIQLFPRRLKNVDDLKRLRVNIHDDDLEKLINDGEITLRRLDDCEFHVMPGKPTAEEIASGHSVAIPQFKGG